MRHRAFRSLGWTVLVTAAVAVQVDQAQAAAPPDPPARNTGWLAGQWIGIYQAYPSYVQLTLTVATATPASGDLAADVRLAGLDGTNAQMGASAGKVYYQPDVPALDIRVSGSNFGDLQFHAVYDAERRMFAGYRVGAPSNASPYFLMARRGDETKLFARLEEMANGTRLGSGFGLGGAPSADVLRRWAAQLVEEYPQIDPHGTEFGALYLMARSLFRDEYFKSFFGKSFDDLANRDLTRINARLEGIEPSRSTSPDERASGAARALASAFRVNGGTFAVPDIMLSVIATRSISGWMRQTLQRLDEVDPGANAFRTLSALEAEERGVLGTFWPSERAAFLKAIEAQRTRLGEPVLVASVEQLVGATTRFEDVRQLQQTLAVLGRTPSPAPARRPVDHVRPVLTAPALLTSSTDDLPMAAALASDGARAQARARIEGAIASLVAAEAQRDEALIAALSGTSAGKGASGLEESGRLFRKLQAKYASCSSQPVVQLLFEGLGRQRRVLLQSAQAELELAIRQASSESALDDLSSRFLRVPSDQTDATGAHLLAAAEAKAGELRLARERAASAWQQEESAQRRARAQRLAEAAAKRQAVGAAYGAYLPTFEDLSRMAVLVPTIAGRTAFDDQARFVGTAAQLGFHLADKRGEVFADINKFENRRGDELETRGLRPANGPHTFTAEIHFVNAWSSLIELYDAELRAQYRDLHRATADVESTGRPIPARSPEFIESGGTIYSYSLADGTFTIQARLNTYGTAAIVAKRLDDETLSVNSFTRATDVAIKRGDRVHLEASGVVTLGPLVGRSSPDGIDSYELFRRESRFRLGSLIGRIGDGDWFLVGARTTVTAVENGHLLLQINDNDPENNDGAFEVHFSVDARKP